MCGPALPAFFVAMGAPAVTGGISAGMVASMAISLAGMAVGVAGSVKQADYQSDMMKRNAKIAGRKAEDALARGREEETAHRMAVQQMIGRAENEQYGRGLGTEEDTTPDSLLEDIYYMSEIDAQIIRTNAEREAQGHLEQGSMFGAQAGLLTQQGGFNAAGSILSGATSMADTWYKYNRPFTPSSERSAASYWPSSHRGGLG